jgi:hypothetical protein
MYCSFAEVFARNMDADYMDVAAELQLQAKPCAASFDCGKASTGAEKS